MLFLSFFILLAVLAGISVVSVAIYLRVYTKRINRRLAGEDTGGVMWSPLRFCLTCAGVFAAIFLVVVAYFAITSSRGARQADQPQTTYQFYTQDDMTGTYLERFSLDENPGYTRHTAQDDHFRYTCFLSQDPYDGMHPGFLVFVEYLGEDLTGYDTTSFQGQFQDEGTFGWGAGGSVPTPVVCFVGSAYQFGGTFTGTYGLFTEADYTRYERASEAALEKDEILAETDYASVKAQFTLQFSASFGADTMTDTDGVFTLGSGQ